MSIPAAVRRRWGLDHGGRVTVVDLGDAVVLLPQERQELLSQTLVPKGMDSSFVILTTPIWLRPKVGPVVIDDQSLRDCLTGERPCDLDGIAPEGFATTALRLFRLRFSRTNLTVLGWLTRFAEGPLAEGREGL